MGGGALLVVALAALWGAAAAAATPWVPAKLPGPAGKVFLLGASCPSPSLCVVTGTNNLIASSTNPMGGSAAWDYTYVGEGPWPETDSWPTAEISGKQIEGVSCPSTSLCVAVLNQGSIYSSTNPTGRASAWKTVQIDDQGRNTHLFGVSCPTVSFCVAIAGKRGEESKILTSTGPTGGPEAWRSVGLGTAYELRGISCPSAALCVAVGEGGQIVASADPAGDASAWRPLGAPAGTDTLHSVSCVATQLCVSGNKSGNLLTTTNPLGAAGWKTTGGGGSVQITGSACASASECLLVDNNGSVLTSTDPTGGRSAWTYDNLIPYKPPAPNAMLEGNALFAASCASRSFCVLTGARGQIFASTDPFARPPQPRGQGAKGRGKGKGRKRPRAKIATVRLPRGKDLRQKRGKVMIRFYAKGARGFVCKFDRRPAKRCRSPKYYRVGSGRHVFQVRAIGSTGLRGPVAREVIVVPPLCDEDHRLPRKAGERLPKKPRVCLV